MAISRIVSRCFGRARTCIVCSRRRIRRSGAAAIAPRPSTTSGTARTSMPRAPPVCSGWSASPPWAPPAARPVDFFRTKYAPEGYLCISGLSCAILLRTSFMEWHAHRFNGCPRLEPGRAIIPGSGTKRRIAVAVRDLQDPGQRRPPRRRESIHRRTPQAAIQRLLVGAEEVVAPFDGVPKGALAGRAGVGATLQEREAMARTVGQFAR